MEAKSLRERAQDLADRLAELRAATKARCPHEPARLPFPYSQLMMLTEAP